MSKEMQTRPLVTVIINCLNADRYMREAIESVYQQTYTHWEIVLWDNASTDSTREIAESFDDKLSVFSGSETIPLYAARNKALEKARGQLIAFLDSDDVWQPHKLEKQVSLFEEDDALSLVYTNYLKDNLQTKRIKKSFKRIQPENNVFEAFTKKYPICISTTMIRKDAACEQGCFFDSRFNLCGDYDAFMRVLYQGKARYIHEPLVVYKIHEAMCSQRHQNDFAGEMEMVRDNMKVLDSHFALTHPKAYEYLCALPEYMRSLSFMREGAMQKARTRMAPYKTLSSKYLLTYLGTFVSPRFWAYCRKVKGELL
jgi:glycosyltransferase involved in cell wall biosynthesis